MGVEMSFPATFPASYRENLLQTIQTIDATKVSQAIEWFRDARDEGEGDFRRRQRRQRGYSFAFRLRHDERRKPRASLRGSASRHCTIRCRL